MNMYTKGVFGRSRMISIVIWAVLYGLSYSLAQLVFPAAVPYAVLSCAVLLLVWLGYRRRLKALHINPPVSDGSAGISSPALLLILFLLLILPAANLLSGGSFASGSTVVLMLGAVLVEEVFFRGVLLAKPGTFDTPLLAWLTEQPDYVKALLSSGLFAVFHAVNAIGGEAWLQIVPQMVCAFCAGMLFAAVTLRTDSLLPAAAGHFLVNITAAEENTCILPTAFGCMLCLAAGILLLAASSIQRGKTHEAIH